MIVRCESCCCVYDDAESDTGCPHYPIGTSAATFCKRCDLYKPCACAPATPRPLPPEQIKAPRGIGINEGEGGSRTARWKSDETGRCCLNCRRGPEAHMLGDRCPITPTPTRRRFVTRGGELVEVNAAPERETR